MSFAVPHVRHEAGSVRTHGSRLVLSFPVMLAGLLVVLSVLTVRHRFDDPDMWWHLKTGEIIWTTHTVPTADPFSFTTHHHSWIPHEWLSQWLIFGAYRLGGYSGLMLGLCFFTAALLIGGYALCSVYSGNAKVSFLGAIVVWLFGTVGLAIRPQMIGYLLLIVELLLIHLGRTRNPRWFLALPPLFAVWINCHGSFFLGLILAGAFLISSYFHFQIGSLVSTRWDSACRRTVILSLLLSVGALFINPIGLKQILYPLNTMLAQPVNLSHVVEWRPLPMNDARGIGLMVLLGCIFLLVIARRAELLWHELLLLSLGTWMAVSHERMLFVFGILAAPVLSRMLSTAWENYDPAQDRILPNAVMLAFSLLIAFLAFPGRQYLARQVEQSNPVKAVEFIKSHHLPGPMMNEYVYGGYLIWAAPEYPVFIDGRADVYEWAGVLADYGSWATLQSDPNSLLERYGINFCLLTRESPMAHVMPLLHNWKTVYSDNSSIVFERTPAADLPK